MSTSLQGFQYKEKLGIALAALLGVLLAGGAFVGAMYLNLPFSTSLEIAGVGLAVGIGIGAAMGASYYPNPAAIGTSAMAMATKPGKTVDDIEKAAVIIQQASVALTNIKNSLNPTSAAAQIDFNALSQDLATAQTTAFMPVLQKYLSGVPAITASQTLPQAKPAA